MECLRHLTQALAGSSSSGAISLLSPPAEVDLLLLGTGWTGSFVLPITADAGLRTASTTRDGSGGTIPFKFDPTGEDGLEQFARLPDALTVVIVFPLYEPDHVRTLVRSYEQTRADQAQKPRWILLGSTGIWKNGPTLQAKIAMDSPTSAPPPMVELKAGRHGSGHGRGKGHKRLPSSPWVDRHSAYDSTNPRAATEDAFLSLSTSSPASRVAVLCLAGLWGHGRSPRRFIGAIASSKERLRALGAVALVHGRDVARAILAMHRLWPRAEGQRWALTNDRFYDMWDLASRWGDAGEDGRNHPPTGPQGKWVQELMAESQQAHPSASASASRGAKARPDALLIRGLDGDDEERGSESDSGSERASNGKSHGPASYSPLAVRALPRSAEQCGSALDSSEFWRTFELTPAVPWVD